MICRPFGPSIRILLDQVSALPVAKTEKPPALSLLAKLTFGAKTSAGDAASPVETLMLEDAVAGASSPSEPVSDRSSALSLSAAACSDFARASVALA